jgi:hypothetical protein
MVSGDQHQSNRADRRRNGAEKDPAPGLAIDQPTLQGRCNGGWRDNSAYRENGLHHGLLSRRISQKKKCLRCDEKYRTREALDDAQSDEMAEVRREDSKR